jgi:hypothetical protein
MYRTLAAICLVVALLVPANLLAQKNLFGGTGKVRFKVNRAGSIALYDKDFTTQLGRASIVVAMDSAHVFDYEEDAMYLTASPILSTEVITDTVITAVFDNSWTTPPPPPHAQVVASVYAAKSDSFVVVDYKMTNPSAATYTVYVGIGCVPEPSETYGGETVAYDSTKKMAYFFRTGELSYVGVKFIGQDPYSFHPLDWDTYSPTDAETDMATDSTRWRMTARPGFDGPIVGGVNGSFFNLNFGASTIDANTSVTYTVAYMYSTSLAGLRKLADSADARYTKVQAALPVKNVYGGTGKVRFKLNRAGSLSLYDKDFTTQIGRASIVIGLDSTHVFDYEQDAYYTMAAPARSVGAATDTIAVAVFDNTYLDPPALPDVRVLAQVHGWKDDPFVLADYTITNYDAVARTLRIGMGCVPYLSEAYGGESIAYDATKKMAYFYRTGDLPYIGIKFIGQDPTSFHPLDWDTYSPTNADADEATDSTRWRMTTRSGFDSPLTAGVNGSFFNLNIPAVTVDAWSSVTYTVAYMYSTSLDGLRTVSDAAVARYNLATAVETVSSQIPEKFALQQNYPNPFNPQTVVSCQLPAASHVKLAVYDMLGREVAVLANGQYPAGQFTFKFDGSRLASGVYFCRLIAGSFVSTTKMVLQK